MERRQSDAAAAGYSPTSWTTNVLPPVELTTEQREKYRVLATQLLSNTLRDYDIYSADPRQRRMSRRRWKPVKTRDHITVYKERYPTPSPLGSSNRLVGQPSRTSRASFADRVSMAFKSNEWTEPKLLVATGWIEGTLDDVMESKGDSSFAGMASFASTGVTTDTDQPMDSFRGIDPGTKTHEDIPEHEEDDDKVEKVVLSDRERREQIWSQMVELRMVAESIYKLTLETTESLNATPQRTPPLYR
ncbi:hypothetical protein PRIC2_004590 [Phytophthora ramorum]